MDSGRNFDSICSHRYSSAPPLLRRRFLPICDQRCVGLAGTPCPRLGSANCIGPVRRSLSVLSVLYSAPPPPANGSGRLYAQRTDGRSHRTHDCVGRFKHVLSLLPGRSVHRALWRRALSGRCRYQLCRVCPQRLLSNGLCRRSQSLNPAALPLAMPCSGMGRAAGTHPRVTPGGPQRSAAGLSSLAHDSLCTCLRALF